MFSGMDWVQIHLALNHLSVMGVPFLLLLFGWGWVRRDAALTRLALWWIAVFSGIAIALKFTGDFAAEQAQPRLEATWSFVKAHEKAADQATAAVFLLGIAAAALLYFGRTRGKVPPWGYTALFLLALAACLLLARTAHLGGEISHPELR